MYENSKARPSRQSASPFLRTEGAHFHEAERLTIRVPSWLSREEASRRAVMEQFGSAIIGLLECNSCYVATMSRAGAELEEARIGCATIDPSCTLTVARIARKGADTDCAFLEPVNARTTFVRKLIGSEPEAGSHSVIGRFASDDGVTVVFVAGWRPAALLSAEIPCLARAVRMMWDTSYARAPLPHRRTDLQTWLEELIFPAIVVDEDLRVHELNRSGRALLAEGKLLIVNRGMLAGSNRSVTESLKGALRETLMSQGSQGWLNTTVTLSTDRQQFAFARFGAVPAQCDTGKVLVIVPQFDEVSGAKRIASAFSLNWAEERIIARILQGRCPRLIGADLRLTEATVRTYTKRIMLKLGINRQSEFFLLYHLTLSPFGAGKREKAVGLGPPHRQGGTHSSMKSMRMNHVT